jgi:NAD(P)-dependent dehydrogenase (short-subunit alcohol dehydrogenase family)
VPAVALVTGGGRGIGRAVALRLAAGGTAVGVADLDADTAARAAAEVTAAGGRAVGVAADVRDFARVRAAVAEVEAALGPLDVLVNNATRARKGNLEQTDPADWAAEIEGTLTGAFLVSRCVLPGMVERSRGAIVNVGSVNGLTYLGNPAYSAGKAGLLNLTRALAVEYGPKGIRTNMVSPGTVRTESPNWKKRLAKDPQVFEKLARWYPVGRVGEPNDIAAAIAFLASDEAAFVNGANLVVDGGLTAGMPVMIEELTLETR